MPLFVAQSDITIVEEPNLSATEVVELYKASGMHRPTDDVDRIQKMLKNSNLKVTARHAGALIGLARALTDFSFCCYISDLCVHREYQRNGIGKALVETLRTRLSDEVMVLMLSNPESMDFYPPLGFQKVGNGWTIPRGR